MPRKKASKPKDSPINEPHSPEPSSLNVVAKKTSGRPPRGAGSDAAGQSGSLQGLSRRAEGSSESVEELLEEGQTHEAEFLSGVENAPEPDQGEVHTREDAESEE